ncbi:MAG TPA: hypothetical protein VLV18_09360, partial [Terriglobales bacterium]|nr:hypothetical protein [Terriglobales bacterium]
KNRAIDSRLLVTGPSGFVVDLLGKHANVLNGEPAAHKLDRIRFLMLSVFGIWRRKYSCWDSKSLFSLLIGYLVRSFRVLHS